MALWGVLGGEDEWGGEDKGSRGRYWCDQDEKGGRVRSAMSLWTLAGRGRFARGRRGDDMTVRVIRLTCHVDLLIQSKRVSTGVSIALNSDTASQIA